RDRGAGPGLGRGTARPRRLELQALGPQEQVRQGLFLHGSGQVLMGLTRKILLFTGLIVVALVATTLLYTTHQAGELARTTISEDLGATRDFWGAFQADRYSKLKLGIRVLGNDPAFKAAVANVEDPEVREATVFDMLRERGQDLAADFFIATDGDGRVIARSDRAGGHGEDLSKDPVV